jgi:non-heme chloroperoxidase
MAMIEVQDGVRLHVQDLGSGEPVVLIAGLGLCHEVWDAEVRDLAAAGKRTVCIDLRGTGDSDKPLGGYDISRMSADIQAVLEALDLTNVTLVGWSFGGEISLHVAATAPERLAKLVIVGSNAVRASASEQFPFGPPQSALAAISASERKHRITSRTRVIAHAFASDPGAPTIDWLMGMFLRMPSWSTLASYSAYLTCNQIDLPAQVTLPVLQIVGDSDNTAPLDGAAWLQEHLSNSELVVLEACGHYPMLEAGPAFRAALLAGVS